MEYCSVAWSSAANSHIKLPDRAVRNARFITVLCLSATLLINVLLQCCAVLCSSGVHAVLDQDYLCAVHCLCCMHRRLPWGPAYITGFGFG